MAATASIITTRHGSTNYGMTATSVTALSMSPPSLIVAINQSASIHEPLLKASAFWVNLLSDEHDTELSVFSGKLKGPERFQHGKWLDRHDIPCLADAQASIYCEVAKTIPFATHTIFIGNVVEAQARESVNPLIYLDGKILSPAERLMSSMIQSD